MNPIVWDFSKAGIIAGLKKFVSSFLKTGGVALAAYALLKLNSYHVPADAHYFVLYTSTLVTLRAAISAFLEWVNTIPAQVITTDVPPSNPDVVVPVVQ